MTTRGLVLVFIAALVTASGNLLMRKGVARAGGLSLTTIRFIRDIGNLLTQPQFDAGLVLYALASIVWFAIISTESLGSSYPLLVSITFILVTSGATIIYDESLSWQKAVDIVIILIDIVTVSNAR